MFDLLLIVGCVFGIVVVFSYFKNLSPDLRKEQIKTMTDSGLVVTGFATTATKDLVKTALKTGQAASVSVERNHRELSGSIANSVNGYINEKGGGNALRAGARSSKELSGYIGLDEINKSLQNYLDNKPTDKPVDTKNFNREILTLSLD